MNGKMKIFKVLRGGLMLLAAVLMLLPSAATAQGGYVTDATVSVPSGAYTTFSTVYNGKRYYLGIDTTAAKGGTYAVAAYDAVNYACMWVVGGLYSPTGAVLDNKNYLRTVKSLWIKERCSSNKYLALGTDQNTYSMIELKDTADATMWYTQKDDRAEGKYIQGYMYYYSDATGRDVYRYLTYDALYKFNRAYGTRPAGSQRISVWDRKKGRDIVSVMTPSSYTFGLNLIEDTVKLPITSKVYLYDGVDRFRSRYDQVDVFAQVPTEVSNQSDLVNTYGLFGFYEWASNEREKVNGLPRDPRNQTALASDDPSDWGKENWDYVYNGKSILRHYGPKITCVNENDPSTCTLTYGEVDSNLVWVSDTKYKLIDNLWYDTIFAIGPSPFNMREAVWNAGESKYEQGDYIDHSDWLRQHFYIKNSSGQKEHFVDSILIVRRTFKNTLFTTVSSSFYPSDHVFPYFAYNSSTTKDTIPRTTPGGSPTEVTTQNTVTFTITANYISGNYIRYTNNAIAQTTIGEERDLDITSMTPYQDPESGLWYDKLTVTKVLLADGTAAIGSEAGQWIQSVTVGEGANSNKITIVAKSYNPESDDVTTNRVAQIEYRLCYRHSAAQGDTAETVHTIWVTQLSKTASDSRLYTFNNKTGKGYESPSTDDTNPSAAQPVHTKNEVLYAIPGQPVQLPIHRDYWGYYRWYKWSENPAGHTDPEYGGTWRWEIKPKNNSQTTFMPINPATDPSSRGYWDIGGGYFSAAPHFEVTEATPIPTLNYPASNSATIQIACDVSAYTDITTVGTVTTSSINLSELTEPTLSYRNIFDIQPAMTQADKMQVCRGNGSGANWMEEHDVIVPAGRPFTLQQQHPVLDVEDDIVEETHLQYIHYFNTTGTGDENMGAKGSLDDTQADSYNRIGRTRETRTSDKTVKLMSLAELNSVTSRDRFIIVNPHKGNGYVLGNDGDNGVKIGPIGGVSTKADLKNYIKTNYLDQSAYIVSIEKVSDGVFVIKLPNTKREIEVYYGAVPAYGWTVRWPEHIDDNYASNRITMTTPFTSPSSDDFIVTDRDSVFAWYMSGRSRLFGNHSGYVVANEYQNSKYSSWTDWALGKSYELELQESGYGSDANRAWCIYKILDETVVPHTEHPVWEKYNGSSWTEVAREGTSNTNYYLTPEGYLHVSENVHTTANETLQYRLRTEHFQLAKFTVYTRNAATEGPSNTEIISEDDMQNNYDHLFTLGNENFPPAGTDEVVAPYHHLPWTFTELSYHYPRSGAAQPTAELEALAEGHTIADANRVFTTDLPAQGEYCYLNKFVDPDNISNVTEAMAGARNGYMLCINAPQKAVKIFDFEYPGLPCPDQEIFLTASLCNPINNDYKPQITADLEGWNGSQWVPVYRFKTGEIPYENPGTNRWYQMVLPIDRLRILSYSKFRCSATLNGSVDEENAYFLLDRIRFIAKKRPMSVFQKRTTCIVNDSVDIVARIDYRNSSFEPGSIVCFQFQRWDDTEKAYIPLIASTETDNGDGTYSYARKAYNATEIYPGYYKTAMTVTEAVVNANLKDGNRQDYGFLVIPEGDYDPSLSASAKNQSEARAEVIHALETYLGDGVDRDGYLNETGLVRTRSQVLEVDKFDFGTYDNPVLKVYVNEGSEDDPYWVLLLVGRVPIDAADKYRIAMTLISDVGDTPDFERSTCATERFVEIKKPTKIQVDGEDFEVLTRVEAGAAEPSKLLTPNQSHTLTVVLNNLGGGATSLDCLFDVLSAGSFDAGYEDMTDEDKTAADAIFRDTYGCTRAELVDALQIFRSEDPANPNRLVTNWNNVTPASFEWSGRDPEEAAAIYELLDDLIVKNPLLYIGQSSRNIYMGNNADAYFYVFPIAASGRYVDGSGDTISTPVCNNPIWLEMHSDASPDSLRFGYDNKVGGTFIVPFIRASAKEANEGLKVRISAITHAADKAVVIGWDSTYVVSTNDPAWVRGTSSFRYYQDKLMQDGLYSNYYKEEDVITFRPVDAAHVTELTNKECGCYDYLPAKTVYNETSGTGVATDENGVFQTPSSAVSGCNKWHVKVYDEDEDLTKRMPGYQKANNFTLHAGYFYVFKTSFFHLDINGEANLTSSDGGGASVTSAGEARFLLAVAPDTAEWTPSHPDAANYWNDDDNWTAIVNGKPSPSTHSRVPMNNTCVIIHATDNESLQPLIDNDALGMDTKEYGFETATCKDILFKPLALAKGQEYLEYERAFVDVQFPTGRWRTFTPALDMVYSGDMYVPAAMNHASPVNTDKDFLPLTFEGTNADGSLSATPDWSAGHNRAWPYAIYQSYFNTTVDCVFQNTDEDGNPMETYSKSSADWVMTNIMDKELVPGHACAMMGWGPTDVVDSMLIVSLPKQETAYHYIGKSGDSYVEGSSVTVRETAFEDLEHNLAYDKTALKAATDAGKEGIEYTITNQSAGDVFFFGNPTMSLIDVYYFCQDNSAVILSDGEGYKFTVYELVTNGTTYRTHTVTAPGQYFIAPMRAIGLVSRTPATELTVTLKPTAMVALLGDGEIVQNIHADPEPAPARMRSNTVPAEEAWLYVSAANETDDGLYKAYLSLGQCATASRGYEAGEDALSLTSGLNYYSAGALSTPLGMYTIAGNLPLMRDLRDSVMSVPLCFTTLDEHYQYDAVTILSFAKEGNWQYPLYLYDALTGDSVLIVNGLKVGIQTPMCDQLRYYINHSPLAAAPETETPTAVEEGCLEAMQGNRYQGDDAMVYDMLGRMVAVLKPTDLIRDLDLPTGVYVIQRRNRCEKFVVR